PSFFYTVKDSAGKSRTDIIEALDENSAVEKLQSDGYLVLNVRPVKEKTAVKTEKKDAVRKKFNHDQYSIEDLLVLSRQLATMLEAGVTMLRSFDVIMGQIQSKELYNAVVKIHADIEQGSALSAALAKHPRIFNQFWVSLAE